MRLLEHGGVTLVLLVITSIILVAVVIERLQYFRRQHVNAERLLRHLAEFLGRRDTAGALALCRENPGALTRVAEAGLSRNGRPEAAIEDAMKVAILEENGEMERYIPGIGTIAVIAPFIGLFGTVLGIIRAFEDIAVNKSAGPDVVSRGVAEALVATAAGLLVAIVAVICFNYFKSRIKQVNLRMSVTAAKVMEIMERGGTAG